MVFQPKTYSVLLVSSSRKFAEVTKELLPVTDYWPVRSAGSEAEARRLMLENEYDIAIINSPLSDDSGFSLAEDISSGSDTAVLLLAPAEVYEDIYFKLLPSGVVTAPKPTSQRLISYSLRVLAAMRERLRKKAEGRRSVEEKIEEIRLVNRAKWALIEKRGMSEDEAHSYIERLAMEKRISKKTAAKTITEELALFY